MKEKTKEQSVVFERSEKLETGTGSSNEKKQEVWSVQIKSDTEVLELDIEDMFRIINALGNLQTHLAMSNLEAIRDRAKEYNKLVWDLDRLYCMMRETPDSVVTMHVKVGALKCPTS